MSKDEGKSVIDLASATGGLFMSMGRFSLAMGLFAARQAATLLSAPGKTADSLDDVAEAASHQLTGVARTAFALGANLQSGLVDAALDAAGIGPRGQAPSGDTSGLAFPLPRSAERRVTGLRTVNSGTLDREVPQVELRERLAEYHRQGRTNGGNHERVVAHIWKSEGLAVSVAKHLLADNTLDDPALARELLPVVHVGFGTGSTERHMFDAGQLNAVFDERCAAGYREFAYEGIGAMLRAYERGLFRLSVTAFGLIPLDAPDGPNPRGFFADYLARFPPHLQRLIAHGYGRLLAFSTPDVYRAIREATKRPEARIEPIVHGIAFAFAMMNNSELPRLLRESAVPFEADIRAAFQNGLVYAVTFMDWFAPGVLAEWQPCGRLEADLIDQARREVALARENGVLLAFRLANPRT